jgi:branched-chain amino acid transport system permease protein
MSGSEAIVQVLSSGLLMGAAYALLAIGFTLVFGVMNIVNFAHGHLAMAAMFVSYALNRSFGLDPYISALVLIPVSLVFGGALYDVAITPLVDAPPAAQMLATLGLLIIIENAANMIFGGDMRSVHVSYGFHSWFVDGLALPWTRLIAAAGSLLAVAIVWGLLHLTRFGAEIRASANNRLGAVLVGIRIPRVFRNAFALSTCTAAFAGALIIPFSLVNPFVGHGFMLKSFVIAIVGGLGSLPGALLAGFLVGIIEAGGDFFLTSSLSTALVFGLLMVMLLVRPAGFFGAARA